MRVVPRIRISVPEYIVFRDFFCFIGNCFPIEQKLSGEYALRRKRKMSQATSVGKRVPRAELSAISRKKKIPKL